MSGDQDYDAYDTWVRQVNNIGLETCGLTGFQLMGFEMFFSWFAGLEPDEAVELAIDRLADTAALYDDNGVAHA